MCYTFRGSEDPHVGCGLGAAFYAAALHRMRYAMSRSVQDPSSQGYFGLLQRADGLETRQGVENYARALVEMSEMTVRSLRSGDQNRAVFELGADGGISPEVVLDAALLTMDSCILSHRRQVRHRCESS